MVDVTPKVVEYGRKFKENSHILVNEKEVDQGDTANEELVTDDIYMQKTLIIVTPRARRSTKNSNSSYTCAVCKMHFMARVDLKHHKFTQTLEDRSACRCGHCKNVFKNMPKHKCVNPDPYRSNTEKRLKRRKGQ